MAIQRWPWPEWVEEWLRLPFYKIKCGIHPKKYNTIYCAACKGEPMCELCWRNTSILHRCDHHPVLRVYISSNRPAIALRDVREFLDISEIQDYVINNKDIVFLNPHEQGVPDGRYTPNCQTCQRRLKPDDGRETGYKFCSIVCKIASTEGGDLKMDPQELLVMQKSRPKFKIIYQKKRVENIAVSFRKRSRKGIPLRAPFK